MIGVFRGVRVNGRGGDVLNGLHAVVGSLTRRPLEDEALFLLERFRWLRTLSCSSSVCGRRGTYSCFVCCWTLDLASSGG